MIAHMRQLSHTGSKALVKRTTTPLVKMLVAHLQKKRCDGVVAAVDNKQQRWGVGAGAHVEEAAALAHDHLVHHLHEQCISERQMGGSGGGGGAARDGPRRASGRAARWTHSG